MGEGPEYCESTLSPIIGTVRWTMLVTVFSMEEKFSINYRGSGIIIFGLTLDPIIGTVR